MKYLTALLNSKLIEYWLRKKGKMQGNNYQIDKEPLLEIPIYKPSDKIQESVGIIVAKIIALKSDEKDSVKLEKQIDKIVYKLYDMSYDDVKIIDPEFELSKKEYDAIQLDWRKH